MALKDNTSKFVIMDLELIDPDPSLVRQNINEEARKQDFDSHRVTTDIVDTQQFAPAPPPLTLRELMVDSI